MLTGHPRSWIRDQLEEVWSISRLQPQRGRCILNFYGRPGTGDWIARILCFEGPHRQFVFTMPKPLRGIFRKRRKLLDHLFRTAIDSLRDWMRVRLELPVGQLAAVAAVQTFGDHLNFHPHLYVLEAFGMVDREGRFHVLRWKPSLLGFFAKSRNFNGVCSRPGWKTS